MFMNFDKKIYLKRTYLKKFYFLGDLVLRSPLVTSVWGDAHLFFRHQDMREDFVRRPEWEQYTDIFGAGLMPTFCGRSQKN